MRGEFYDKLRALQALGKHLAFFKERVELTGNLAKDVEADGSNVRGACAAAESANDLGQRKSRRNWLFIPSCAPVQ
jgi:hypothetical protein